MSNHTAQEQTSTGESRAERAGKEESRVQRAAGVVGIEGEPKRGLKRGNVRFYAVVGIAAVLAGLLIWQWARAAALQRDFAGKRAALAKEHERALDAQAAELLRTAGSILRWAVAPLLADGRFDAIGEQIRPLVKEEPIMVVAVADDSLVVRIATNHKLEGQSLADAFPGIPAAAPDVTSTHVEDGILTVVPIFEAEREIGRAVIFFQHTHPLNR